MHHMEKGRQNDFIEKLYSKMYAKLFIYQIAKNTRDFSRVDELASVKQ